MSASRDSGDARIASTAAARQAADQLGDRLALGSAPVAAIILGSGLGGLAARIENARRVPFREVPGFPQATVHGHAGVLIAGTLAGRPVLAMAGRFHLYEGHAPRLAGYPVRVLHALGARTLFVSNAAGGINRNFAAGDLMVIADHINLMFRNPLEGALEPGDIRFPTCPTRTITPSAPNSTPRGNRSAFRSATESTPASSAPRTRHLPRCACSNG